MKIKIWFLITNLLSKQIDIWKQTKKTKDLFKIFKILKSSSMKDMILNKLIIQKNSLARMKKTYFLTTLFLKKHQKMKLAEKLAHKIKISTSIKNFQTLTHMNQTILWKKPVILILFLKIILNMVLKFTIKTPNHLKMLNKWISPKIVILMLPLDILIILRLFKMKKSILNQQKSQKLKFWNLKRNLWNKKQIMREMEKINWSFKIWANRLCLIIINFKKQLKIVMVGNWVIWFLMLIVMTCLKNSILNGMNKKHWILFQTKLDIYPKNFINFNLLDYKFIIISNYFF